MADARSRTLVSVRATCEFPSARTAAFARAHRFETGKPFSFDRVEPQVTGAEQLLGILAAELLRLFAAVARERRLEISAAEASVQAELTGTLRALGVIGATEVPRYRNISLRAWVDSPADPAALHDAWREATQRAPLLNTLGESTGVEVTMQLA